MAERMEFAPRHSVGGSRFPINSPPFPPPLHSSTTLAHLSQRSEQKRLHCPPDRRSAFLDQKEYLSVMERRAVAVAGEAAPPRLQLPPGFRFHPTDVELVVQYLRRKVLARPLPAAVIPVVHAAVLPDPWDLPGASEGEAAYFFSLRQAPASGSSGRRRRAASGYWKATGKEKPVFVQLQGLSGRGGSGEHLLVGVKTALAFRRGKGKARTDWVMHEYRLAAGASNGSQSSAAPAIGEWVVCRVSLKSRARRSAAGDAGDETPAVAHREEDAGDDQPHPSPSSSCVTDTCHASDHQEEVSSTTSQQ